MANEEDSKERSKPAVRAEETRDGGNSGDAFKSDLDRLFSDVKKRAQAANPRLRTQLAGSILLELTEDQSRYYIDGTEAAPAIVPHSPEKVADCTIAISKRNLFKVADGELNPQIAMLSDKVKVSGKLGLAVYFFNLLDPRRDDY